MTIKLKNKAWILAAIYLSSCASMTQSQKRMATSFGAASVAYMATMQAGKNANDDVDVQKTALAYSTIFALAGHGAGELLFPSEFEKENKNLRHVMNQQEGYMIDESLKKTTPQRSYFPKNGEFIDYDKMPSSQKALINPNCVTSEFSLGFDRSFKTQRYLPVSEQVIIEGFRYWLVVPRDGKSTSTPCVKSNSSFGYLEREFKNLPEILIEKAVKK